MDIEITPEVIEAGVMFLHESGRLRSGVIGPDRVLVKSLLQACLAVIRFKQLRGFYFEEIPYYHLLLEIGDLKVGGSSDLNED